MLSVLRRWQWLRWCGGFDSSAHSMSNLQTKAVRRHYDRLSIFYWWLWGEHIHHGFWRNGESPAEAQMNLTTELARRAAIPRGATVLDVGCGLGGSAFWLARELDCSVVGITISPMQKRIAEKRAQLLGLSKRVQFRVMDANELDFAAESFDAIWTIECSEHLADKATFIKKCARLLRHRGAFGLCAWLAAEPASRFANSQLLAEICSAMLCPSLARCSDYETWMQANGLVEVHADDITRHVEQTWEICGCILKRPAARLCLALTGRRTRQFAAAFGAVHRAYREGAMRYGMFTARKP